MTTSPAAGSVARNQYGTFAVHAPTEPQLKFAARLVATKDTTGLEDDYEAYRSGRMNKKAASRFIDELLSRPDAATGPVAIRKPASAKQTDLIKRLATERVWAPTPDSTPDALKAIGWIDQVLMDEAVESWQASKGIDHLFASPKAQAAAAPAAELESGMYRVGETIYKVYRAVHGSGRMCAKELVVGWTCEGHESTDGPIGNVTYCDGTCRSGEVTATFEYRGLATRFVTADARMSLEDAKAFGAIYGVCCQCGATLTAEASIEAGIGPVCAGKI